MKAYRSDASGEQRKQNDRTFLSQYREPVGIPHCVTDASQSPAIWADFSHLSVPSSRTFALVSEAIRERQTLQITYQSMREPAPHQRIIAPHSLIRAGRLDSPAQRTDKDDRSWMTKVLVRLVAHPDLTPEQDERVQLALDELKGRYPW